VLEFEASGLRQNEFCRNHGLALIKKRRLGKVEAKEGSYLVAVELQVAPKSRSPFFFDSA